MPIEIGPIAPVRPRVAGEARANPQGVPADRTAAPVAESAVRTEAAALAAAPPVDADRVAAIRAALADGTYPLVPTRIADAMIAAGLRLSLGE